MNPSEVIRGFGRAVAYYPSLTKHLGGVSATVLFCQLTYWMDKITSDLGVHKTAEEIEAETGLSYEEQLTARKKLKKLGVLVETNKRLEHRIYYKVNFEQLDQILTQAFDNKPNGQNPFGEKGKANFGNEGIPCPRDGESPARGEGKAHFDPTEITTEITTENKTHSQPDKQSDDLPGKTEKQKTKQPRIDYQEYFDAYNEILGDRLPWAKVITDKRRAALKRLLPKLKTANVEGFRAYLKAFSKMARSFYFGENERGWRADIDYILKEQTLVAVREGSIGDSEVQA
ncbi:hypothetical protein RY966_002387 [Enterobacter kobei]|nr:hypothetical protein [Enterobacter kobei]